MENESFKVGDKVFVETRWIARIETIKRETKTRFYTDCTSFYKKDNRIVGETSRKVVKATQEHTQEHFEMFEKGRLASRLGVFDFHTLNLDILKEIDKLIKSKDEGTKVWTKNQ